MADPGLSGGGGSGGNDEPYDPRIAELRRRWQERPTPRAGLQLAEELRRKGRLDESQEVLERSLDQNPGHLSSLVALGKTRLALSDPAGAVRNFEQVVDRDPTHLVANKQLVEAYLQEGEGDRAEARLEHYRLLNGGDPEIEALATRIAELGSAAADPASEPDAEPEPEAVRADGSHNGSAAEPTVWRGSDGEGEPFAALGSADWRRYLDGLRTSGLFPLPEPPEPPEPAEASASEPAAETGDAAGSEPAADRKAAEDLWTAEPAESAEPAERAEPAELAAEPAEPAEPAELAAEPAPLVGTAPVAVVPEPLEEPPEEHAEEPPWEPAAEPEEPTVETAGGSAGDVAGEPAEDTAAEDTAAEDTAAESPAAAAVGELELPPAERARATSTLGELYLAQGHLGEAETVFRQVLEANPDDGAAAAGLAEALRRRERGPTAQSLLRWAVASGAVSESDERRDRRAALLKAYAARVRSRAGSEREEEGSDVP